MALETTQYACTDLKGKKKGGSSVQPPPFPPKKKIVEELNSHGKVPSLSPAQENDFF